MYAYKSLCVFVAQLASPEF